MTTKPQTSVNMLPGILILAGIAILVFVGSLFAFHQETDTIQGQADVTEYRVSSKVPARISKILVQEGQTVHAGDTLVILTAPEVSAKLVQAEAAEDAAAAQDRKAIKGAREEQIRGAFELWQKSKAGVMVAQKSYNRVKNLYDQGVTTAQKLDEITAQRDAAIATEKAAKSQYDMAINGAQQEDKDAAKALVNRAKGAVSEVRSYIKETVLVASEDGEVTEIFPEVGELVGTGAPIMNIAIMKNMWVTFNVREDHLPMFAMNKVVTGTVPGLGNKKVKMRVYYMKDLGSYAAWKATKTTGQFDMKTFEVKAMPVSQVPGLRPGMSVLLDQKVKDNE